MEELYLCQAIRKLREQKGYSQKKLAEISGVEPSMLNKYENGKKIPNHRTVQKIASALGCEVGQLYIGMTDKILPEELLMCAKPLIELLQKKGNPMMAVQVTGDGADLYVAQCGTGKHPRIE